MNNDGGADDRFAQLDRQSLERTESVRAELSTLKSGLAAAAAGASPPGSGPGSWDRSTIISLLALLFSLTTALVGGARTCQQDRVDTRRAALDVIQRLGDLQRTPPMDPGGFAVAQEISVLSHQAAALASSDPKLFLP